MQNVIIGLASEEIMHLEWVEYTECKGAGVNLGNTLFVIDLTTPKITRAPHILNMYSGYNIFIR